MVLVTDSRTTSTHGRYHWDNPQKLFKLDDKTVCSFANFATDIGPVVEAPAPTALLPETDSALQRAGKDRYDVLPFDSAAVIQSFAQALQRQSKEPRFKDKVEALAATLGLSLHELANELSASSTRFPGDYEIQLLVAGYDIDGQAYMAKRIIRIKHYEASPPEYRVEIGNVSDLLVATACRL
jgi:hypothetical protein